VVITANHNFKKGKVGSGEGLAVDVCLKLGESGYVPPDGWVKH